ncbi:MAG: MarR family winged helix-turn-helix transcriptional regulator [Bacillota bacterium]
MHDDFAIQLNDLFVDTFRIILKVEEATIKKMDSLDLSISELHLLEAIGRKKDQKKTISDIALHLGVTLPSVTVAINKLVKKGYVVKKRCEEDGRIVFVSLTRLGHKVDLAHSYFHAQMNRKISLGLNEEEKRVMLIAMDKLNGFFKQKLADMEV